jgi:hypothetical protein
MDDAWHDLLKFVGIEEEIAEPGKGSAPSSKVHVSFTGGAGRGDGSPTVAVRRSRRRELLTASNVVRAQPGRRVRLGWSL